MEDCQPRRRGVASPRVDPNGAFMSALPAWLVVVVLLAASNLFMTFAWYGHLKFKATPIVIVILASWGIAFFEYCLQVPANRLGHASLSAAELKTIQEAVTLVVFVGFSATYLGEPIRWNHWLGFALMTLAVFVIFKKW
jgi:uncharacterized protein (DUF486 family)